MHSQQGHSRDTLSRAYGSPVTSTLSRTYSGRHSTKAQLFWTATSLQARRCESGLAIAPRLLYRFLIRPVVLDPPTYNRPVRFAAHHPPSSQNFWTRFAAFLSFLAVLSALLAPVSMLAEEVRTGKLGGLCSLNNAVASSTAGLDGGGADMPQQQGASHCDLCSSLGLALPVLVLGAIPSFAGDRVASFTWPADIAATVAGLPFSRGPPSFSFLI
jgi:hypothetical protein